MPMMQPPSGPGSAPGPMQSSAPAPMAPPGGMGSPPPGMGSPPDSTGMTPPDGGPGSAPETPDFEDAMAALVQHSLPTLNPQDMKVLTKSLTPDAAWVLSKIFGPKAITMLEMAANPKLATAPMGPTGQSGLGAGAPPAPQGQPTGGMPPVA